MCPEHDYRDIIAAVYRVVGAAERRFDSLREADREASRNSLNDLSRRLAGFPEMYATKVDMAEAAHTLQQLEREALTREMYDQQHAILEDAVATKLNAAIFQNFTDRYRIDQERNATEHEQFVSQEFYDQRHASMMQQVLAVERWQYKIVGALVFATFIAPLITGILVYLFTKGII